MSSSSLPKLGLICFDVESTGEFIGDGGDEVFAIGIVSCNIENPTQVEKTLLCLDLQRPHDVSWDKIWAIRSYDQRCFDEFWSKNLHILDALQDKTNIKLCSSQKKFAKKINKALQHHEELYEKTLLVSDTTNYDTVCVGHLLSLKRWFRALNYTRAGQHRSGVHLKSYISGLAGIYDPSDGQTIKEFKEKFIEPLIVTKIDHDHNPVNDAHHILLTYMAALEYARSLDGCSVSPSKRAREA